MLKGIPKILSPELLKVLCEMGHSDTIVIADGNFPAETMGKNAKVKAEKYKAENRHNLRGLRVIFFDDGGVHSVMPSVRADCCRLFGGSLLAFTRQQ